MNRIYPRYRKPHTVTADAFAREYADLFGGSPDEFVDDFERLFHHNEAELSEADISQLHELRKISAGQHDALLFALEEAAADSAWGWA